MLPLKAIINEEGEIVSFSSAVYNNQKYMPDKELAEKIREGLDPVLALAAKGLAIISAEGRTISPLPYDYMTDSEKEDYLSQPMLDGNGTLGESIERKEREVEVKRVAEEAMKSQNEKQGKAE